jgi:hypothetical protein
VSASAMTVVVPPGADGHTDVRVTLPGGPSTVRAGAFRYQACPLNVTSSTSPTRPWGGTELVADVTLAVSAPAGCSWNAVVAQKGTWMVPTGATSGTGPGTVTYRVQFPSAQWAAPADTRVTVGEQVLTFTFQPVPPLNTTFTKYLAEGATSPFFDTRLALFNPYPDATSINLVFSRPGAASISVPTLLQGRSRRYVDVKTPGAAWADLMAPLKNAEFSTKIEKSYELPATSRTNIWVNAEEFPGLGRALSSTDVSAVIDVTNDQPIVVERAMYLDRPGQMFGAGHESAGVTTPFFEWFLAEGATGPYFDLFVLIANPENETADIEASFLLPDGTTVTKRYQVAGNSRFNIWVDQEDPLLANTAVSTTIRSLNEVPVIVERAMWWPGDFSQWHEAHNSPGALATGTKWALAEGEVGDHPGTAFWAAGGRRNKDTYILIANTSRTDANVKVTLVFEGTKPSVERTFQVPPRSRFNVDVRSEFPEALNQQFSALVETLGDNPARIVVERAMYWVAAGQRWAAGTNALATKLQ